MLTEEEAREKWCPFARVPDHYSGGATAGNKAWRPHAEEPIDKARCIASQCMAWRWGGPWVNKDGLEAPPGTTGFSPMRGFCGLAGKPE